MSVEKFLTLRDGVTTLVSARERSNGLPDAGKVLALNEAGELDASLLPAPRRLTIIIEDPTIRTYPLGFIPGPNSEIVIYNGAVLNRHDDYILEDDKLIFVDAFPLEGYSDVLGESKVVVIAMPLLGTGPALMPIQERDLVFCITYQGSMHEIPFILETPFKGDVVYIKGISFNPIDDEYAFNVQKATPNGWVNVVDTDIVVPSQQTEVKREMLQGCYPGDKFKVIITQRPTANIGAITISVHVKAH